MTDTNCRLLDIVFGTGELFITGAVLLFKGIFFYGNRITTKLICFFFEERSASIGDFRGQHFFEGGMLVG